MVSCSKKRGRFIRCVSLTIPATSPAGHACSCEHAEQEQVAKCVESLIVSLEHTEAARRRAEQLAIQRAEQERAQQLARQAQQLRRQQLQVQMRNDAWLKEQEAAQRQELARRAQAEEAWTCEQCGFSNEVRFLHSIF